MTAFTLFWHKCPGSSLFRLTKPCFSLFSCTGARNAVDERRLNEFISQIADNGFFSKVSYEISWRPRVSSARGAVLQDGFWSRVRMMLLLSRFRSWGLGASATGEAQLISFDDRVMCKLHRTVSVSMNRTWIHTTGNIQLALMSEQRRAGMTFLHHHLPPQHGWLEYKVIKVAVRGVTGTLCILPLTQLLLVVKLEVGDDDWYRQSDGQHAREGAQGPD